MVKILGYLAINFLALLFSTIALVLTFALMDETASPTNLIKLGMYLGLVCCGLFFYIIGKKLFQTI